MAATEFKINLVEREACRVVGLKVRTTMAQAAIDAPRQWEEVFCPRMAEIKGFPTCSFGVSVMADEKNLDYWTALPLLPGATVPQGMETLDLPAGLYAECHVNSPIDMVAAYGFIHKDWMPGSGYDYRLKDAPCYELYPTDHLTTGHLSIYMPLRRKSG